MADEGIHKQDFNVRNVTTRSVTLYPSRAHIVREVDDVTLKPGTNEITIYGLTPTADESSIKVEGKGSATITDMSVELVPNNENYEIIYPESEGSESDTDDDSNDDIESDEASQKTTQIKDLEQKLNELEDEIDKATEESRISSAQLAMIKLYGDSLGKERPAANELSVILAAYKTERARAFEAGAASKSKLLNLRKQQEINLKMLAEAERPIKKAKQTKRALKLKEQKQRQQARNEKERAQRHLKDEREQFWPRKVYRVIVTLETYTFTPASSRRGSIDTTVGQPSVDDSACDIKLSVSYVTSAACWAPRYELSLNTINSTGLVTYRAEFCNTTSETWSDTKVVLSTSHTAFQGLGDTIPKIFPWHIKLSKKTVETADSASGILYSDYERAHKQSTSNTKADQANESRATLFGVGAIKHLASYTPSGKRNSDLQNDVYAQTQGIRRAIAAIQESRSNAKRRSVESFEAVGCSEGVEGLEDDEDMGFGLFDDQPTTNIPELPSLEHQESSWSESGLTATYEIPGTRTIAPSPTTRRQKIASISLKDVSLSYHLVPKLRAAAFLKARLHNTSSVTLLKGPCGLTLDGSFLGNTHLPRCSAGERFSLSLGVDPSINVSYSKPIVKRGQTGFLQREGSGIFTRTCTITNTKSDRVVEGVVIDQIPVSEDERLRVDILDPAGLRGEGSTTCCSAGITADGKADTKAGDTLVTLKRGGFVRWDVRIKPGGGVKLELEYEARFPSTDLAVGADDVAEESEDEAFGLFD